MRVTIDRVGRVVIPKGVRDALGLVADAEVDLVLDGASIRLDPVAPSRRVLDGDDGMPVLEKIEGFVVTDDDVRLLRDELQR
jgi:AbrB family looped-hinge helix DNA binding protein